MTQRNNTPISMCQFRDTLSQAWQQGHVHEVLVDRDTRYIHFYCEGVLVVSTKWDNCAQISNNWLARHGLAQGML